MHTGKTLLLLNLLLFTLAWPPNGVLDSQPALPTGPVSGAIRWPDGYRPPALEPAGVSASVALADGLKAVAIVGDVGGSTSTYSSEMDGAVAVLQDQGASVAKFYYGDTSFTWADIVAASQGVHFLLYMGHGVYNGDMPYPDWVGGFYLGGGQFVSPDQIRDDLDGVVAPDSVVIFSHACFTAGSAGGDPSDLPQSEAERRVKMYAEPFMDIGMRAYFANNYYHSAARTVDLILAESAMEDVFKGGVGYNASNLVDLSYPKTDYDLWLDGTPGHWNLSFVGVPEHVFQVEPPALGPLPDALGFIYSIPDGRLVPSSHRLTLVNEGNGEALTWGLTVTGTWLAVASLEGTTPGSFYVTPTTFSKTAVGAYMGMLTVNVVDPAEVEGSPQSIDLRLQVSGASIRDVYLPMLMK
jgi:hypothetical protein